MWKLAAGLTWLLPYIPDQSRPAKYLGAHRRPTEGLESTRAGYLLGWRRPRWRIGVYRESRLGRGAWPTAPWDMGSLPRMAFENKSGATRQPGRHCETLRTRAQAAKTEAARVAPRRCDQPS